MDISFMHGNTFANDDESVKFVFTGVQTGSKGFRGCVWIDGVPYNGIYSIRLTDTGGLLTLIYGGEERLRIDIPFVDQSDFEDQIMQMHSITT